MNYPENNPASILNDEIAAVRSMYVDLGYLRSDEVGDDPLVAGIAKAFMPDQFPHASALANASIPVRHYYEKTLQPELQKGINSGDDRIFALGRQVGRVLAGIETISPTPTKQPVEISSDAVSADGHTVPFSVETGNVIEYGMGRSGLSSHIKNLKARKYTLTGIHRRRGEVAVLQGFAGFYGLTEDEVTITDKGIAYRSGEMLKKQGPGTADLIVASRVHEAGAELRVGLIKGEKLLRTDGLVVARGPREYPKGMNYDQVAAVIRKALTLQVELDTPFDAVLADGHIDPSRLIVARKI